MNQSTKQKFVGVETSILTPEQMRPAKDPFSWSGPVERNMVKARVMKVAPTARTRKEKDTWDAIMREEAHDDRIAAVTHLLLDSADKWGRKAGLAVTDYVGTVGVREKKRFAEVQMEHAKRDAEIRAAAKRDMANIQNKLVKDLAVLKSDRDADMYRIRVATKPSYDEAAAKLEEIRNRVVIFALDIGELRLEQLERVLTGAPVTIVHEGVEKTVLLPSGEG